MFSSEEGRVQRSAMSYFMGFYPPQKGLNNITTEEAYKAIPPFILDNL